ncbi:conjugative transposon protein TraK [Bacteroidia bacterium]|nr:conjugative transposon protein TraK [Bacteroidia bacterium]
MSKFFQSLIEVNVANKFYKTLAIISVCVSAVVCLWAIYAVTIATERERRSLYTLDVNGNVLTMVRSSTEKERPIEAKAHVRMLLEYLFDIDRFTYKNKLKRAYDLGNNSIYTIYKEQEAGGWYTDVEQFNAHSTLIVSHISCTNESPFLVTAEFLVIINSDVTKDKRYDLIWDVVVEDGTVARTEQNPHNMMVTQIRKKKFEEVAEK